MTQNEFQQYRNQAIENMRQMNARSTNKEHPPKKEKSLPPPTSTSPIGVDIPILNILSTDKDAALIIGLLLILMSEKSDKMLLFALVYILL